MLASASKKIRPSGTTAAKKVQAAADAAPAPSPTVASEPTATKGPASDWPKRARDLRGRFHELVTALVVFANGAPKDLDWGIATDQARPVDVADVLSKLATILNVLYGLVEAGDVDGLSKIERLARKIAKRPARNERSEQATRLESLLDSYLEPRSGRLLTDEERDELAKGFVKIVYRDRALPITRKLTRLGTLVEPFQADAVAKVRLAFKRAFDRTKPPDAERLVGDGLRALGYPDDRDLFQFKSKRGARSTDK
jgi:hypothetical protein